MNKVMLKGFLASDPEVLTTKSGKVLSKTTIAINRRYKKEETDFIQCTAWEKTAEFINNYFKKGSEILVVGRIEIDKYQDNEGKQQYRTNIIIEEAYFCGKKTTDNKETPKQNPSSKLPDRNIPKLNDDEIPF